MSLSREAILKAKPGDGLQKVSTPEWGGKASHVYVRRIRASGYVTIQKLATRLKGGVAAHDDAIASVLAWCMITMCDAEGKALFKPTDVNKLMELEFAPLQRCFTAAMDVNGFSEDAGDDAAKNSKPIRS